MIERLIIIVGPTASGKSELAVKVAKSVGGEIISADSRQIYRGMDIGTGKVPGKWVSRHPGRHKRSAGDPGSQSKAFVYKSIPHYLIDEVSPRSQYSVAKFQKQSQKAIKNILKHGKVPILCGGTGYFIDAAVFDQSLPEVKPDLKLRASLSKLTSEELLKKLQKLDPERASEIDAKNPRRLIRAVEIVMSTGKPVPKIIQGSKYDVLWLGILPAQEILHKKIAKRLKERLRDGMVEEVKKLRASGLSWKKLESFGLEYKFIALYLQNKLTHPEMEEQLGTAIKQYAKRQMTWWKRNKEIHWSDKPSKLLALAKKPVK